tara:strand:+ start:340 stop:606 length:267 start_codon:yes stop_codon:yes gene_type:complete
MGLEDLTSLYGPTNPLGQKGTGGEKGKGDLDIFAFENGKGLADSESLLQTSTPHGTKATGPDVFGNVPAERLYEGGVGGRNPGGKGGR